MPNTLLTRESLQDEASVRSTTTRMTEEEKDEIFREFRRKLPVEEIARRCGRSKSTINRVIRERRIRRLWEKPIEFVHNEEFEDPRIETQILRRAPEGTPRKRLARTPAGLPPYLASLYEFPLLSRGQEVHYFKKMNYLKYQAAGLRDRLDPKRAKLHDIDRIEDLLQRAADIKNLLVRRNLRLVVSIAKAYAKPSTNLFELVSDGNVSLMRAIDRFDYSKGFKLSTYATWAIRNNFTRTVPSEFTHLERFRSGHDELFQHSQDERTSQYEQEQTNQCQHDALTRVLERLDDRDREIIVSHFGMSRGSEPQTLEQIGDRFGVSKERIRQLEARALTRLREMMVDEKLDIPGL